MASNNTIGTSTRNELGLSQTAPGSVTDYTIQITSPGAPFPLPLLITDGTDGNDTIESSQSMVFGMGGDDLLIARPFNTLFGGTGNDTFKFAANNAIAGFYSGVILDFEAGDKIDLTDTGLSFADLNIAVNEENTFANIQSTNGKLGIAVTSLFDLNTLTESAFVFGTSTGGGDDTTGGGNTDPSTQIEFNGSALAEAIDGNALANYILGLSGNDTILGGAGNDTINGNADLDSLFGGLGEDLVRGGKGNDFINGNAGNDTVLGDLNDDTVRGGKGDDTVRGGKDNDFVTGDNDNDHVYGDKGNDTIHGGKLNDFVSGGDGNDFIYGDKGNDTLEGNAGNDMFVFRAESGVDVINDFETGIDLLQIDGALFANAAAVVAAFSDGVLNLGSGNQVTLTNITTLLETDVDII